MRKRLVMMTLAGAFVGDYKSVGGVLLPHLYDSNTKGSAEHYQLIFEKIELNLSIEDSIFPMPVAK